MGFFYNANQNQFLLREFYNKDPLDQNSDFSFISAFIERRLTPNFVAEIFDTVDNATSEIISEFELMENGNIILVKEFPEANMKIYKLNFCGNAVNSGRDATLNVYSIDFYDRIYLFANPKQIQRFAYENKIMLPDFLG